MSSEYKQFGSVRFDGFELRRQSDELYRDGSPLKLAPQPYKVLLYLVENAGRLVTRAELRDSIWGPDTFVDFDKGLNLCIAQIREILGDSAQAPLYIETLPKRGYRFIAGIETDPENEDADIRNLKQAGTGNDDSTLGNSGDTTRSWNFGARLAFLFALLIFVIAGAGFLYYRGDSVAPPSSAIETKSMLLVLPLENLTNDPEQDYFSDGLTEEFITRLGALRPRSLGVIARTTALKYKKTTKDVRQIGAELGVTYVLEGSVRREGGRIRITSQLIQVKDQTHLWAETFDREDRDVLDIQREVATKVAAALKIELLPISNPEIIAAKTKPEAYDAYLKGRFLITKDNQEDLGRSIPYFDQAIATDPGFAPAYAAEVEALTLQWDSTDPQRESRARKAKSAALKAVELDPAYSESFAALGSVQLWMDWDAASAQKNFQRAIELNPNNPLTRINYGRCLLALGQFTSAASEIDEALKLDPVGLLTTGIAAYAYLQVGHYDEAVVLANRMRELEPRSWGARECLFRSYVNKEDYTRAVAIHKERMEQRGERPEDVAALDKGNPKEVLDAQMREDLAEIRESAGKGKKIWTMYAAWLSIKLGDKNQTFRWLEKAADDRSSFLIYLDEDPAWEVLRSDPRFRRLKERISADTREPAIVTN